MHFSIYSLPCKYEKVFVPQETIATRSGNYCQLIRCNRIIMKANARQHSRLFLNLCKGQCIQWYSVPTAERDAVFKYDALVV